MNNETYEALKRVVKRAKINAQTFDEDVDLVKVEAWIREVAKEIAISKKKPLPKLANALTQTLNSLAEKDGFFKD